MHSAPAVSYPVGRSRFQGWLVGVTGVGGVVSGALWRYQSNPAEWQQWLFAMTLLGACLVAAVTWNRSPRGTLRWDGQVWRWASLGASVEGLVTVHLDFHSSLVLSLNTDTGTSLWLWPERRADAARWNDLRRAVFSRRGVVKAPGAATEAALAQVKS
ncbi:hypothetical protein [Rhodoferax ferrireducens]|uniref:hypothetical protein n=1 Tax=Rhodoferax ferrireducens TaxID=192843 RepID=UPI000E0D7FB1|nr:hypothetical protein [Rhodoferax ferrireducens]